MEGSFALLAVDSVRLMREVRAVSLAMAVCMGSVVRRDTGVALVAESRVTSWMRS
jgi:hypothetical protein